MERVIGIDLGTTNSCVAAVLDGTPTVFANKGGYKTTPSVFALTMNEKRVVGHVAKRQAIINAEGTIHAFKRLIGRRWGSEEQVRALETLGCKLVKGKAGDVRFDVNEEVISVPEVASHLLAEMREVAEAALGEAVTKAVVTVPAYFNDSQRQATKDAGRIAGLDVIRIINEPTAAALAYGFGKMLDQLVVVFDLGGGTFDVSILRIADGVFDVRATSGDTFLGGEDFDQRIIEWLVFKFASEGKGDLRQDKMAMQRLKEAAERAKCELSTARSTEINLPFIQSGGNNEASHLQATLTREKLEELCEDLVDRTIATCKQLFEASSISPKDVDEVILVGGQTRMPKIQEHVAKMFGREPCKSVHPDEVVALGAAIQGSLLTRPEEIVGASSSADMLLLDVTPMSLGIMILRGFFQVLIPANTTVPTSASHVFTTVQDDQTQTRIVVFQGESKQAAENELLGEFVLTGLRKAPRGEVEVEVTFEIDADGTVGVKARDLDTGKEQAITVTASHGLSEEEISELCSENAAPLPAAVGGPRFESLRTRAQECIDEMNELYPRVETALRSASESNEVLTRTQIAKDKAQEAMLGKDLKDLENAVNELEICLWMYRSSAAGAS